MELTLVQDERVGFWIDPLDFAVHRRGTGRAGAQPDRKGQTAGFRNILMISYSFENGDYSRPLARFPRPSLLLFHGLDLGRDHLISGFRVKDLHLFPDLELRGIKLRR